MSDTGEDAAGSDSGMPVWSLDKQDLIRHWYFLAELSADANKARDRTVVAGAAGGLILSITFLDQIASDPSTWSLVVLLVAWGLLLTSLGCALYGWHATSQAFAQHLRTVGEIIQEAREPTLPDPELDEFTKKTIAGSLIALTLGVLLLAFFAAVNLPWGGSSSIGVL